ncbi:MAG: 4-(cytidine 5'-diphospho)-2-C-methyl-D-erythritol kinase [Parvularculaceae bacterium]|nr:4-(cytidine 5'-diphospho)-2-C-methyl-D-erythritol kinase [Parvularculaceae bacterium]
MIQEIAPAKINLYLHVGPVRRDRLHDLKSLFVFADGGDVITVEPARGLSLEVTGPFAAALMREPVESNLAFRAACLLKHVASIDGGARITLDKRLPIASGVGGGSADAAAALRALVRLWKVSITNDRLRRLAFSLGADVPACLAKVPILVSGAGETLRPAPRLAPLWICLVNPGVTMPTGPVFRAFDAANPSPAPPVDPAFTGLTALKGISTLLRETRNDLEPYAVFREPAVAQVIKNLTNAPGAFPARMSGSGATVFALFSSRSGAARAARSMQAQGWWAMDARIYGAGEI